MIRWMGTIVRSGIRGAWYTLLAAVILAGLPWALIHFVGWPLPRAVPNLATLQDWVDQPTAARWWKGIALIAWGVWGVFTYVLGWELLARLGRIRVPRLRIRPVSGLAAGMVGATATTLAASAGHAHPPAAVTTMADHDTATDSAQTQPIAWASYTVEHGDWLATIADRFLGDRNAYPRIQALNPQLTERGPHHIERGWRLRLPADADDRGIRLHAAGTLHPPTPPTGTVADHGSVTAAPTEHAEPPPADPNVAHQPTADEPSDLDDDGGGAPDVVVAPSTSGAMAGAGLLASLLFAMLTAERRRQRSFYPPGLEPPLPANGRAERELRAAQQPADVARLDDALRNLSHSLALRQQLPDIIGIRLVGADVHVLLAAPDDDPPPPWLDEGTQWALPGYIEPADTHQPTTLLPLLVTIGSRAGRHLLIDLERLGTLTITGHPYRVRDVLRHLVCELACNTWSGHPRIILAGFPGDETDTLAEIGPDRITTATPADAIAAVHTELAQRTHHPDPDNVAPVVLVVAGPNTATRTALTDLHTAIAATGRCGVAVVATVPDEDPIGTATLTINDTAVLRAELPGLALTTDAATMPVDLLAPMAAVVRAARLTPTTAPADDLPAWDDTIDPTDGVLALFEPASPTAVDRPADPPPPPTQSAATNGAAPADTLDADIAAWQHHDPTVPRIAILGPIDPQLPGTLNDSRRRLYTELLLYLLTRTTHAATREQIEDALWYGNPAGDTTIRKAVYKLRRWLGPRPDGTDWIPDRDSDTDTIRLHDGILLDWHLMLRLRERGHHRGADGIADFRTALDLVRGAPMRDAPDRSHYRRPYTWIGDSDIAPGRILATITDLAHRVAEHHLSSGDTTTARWAIQQAWLADPHRSHDDLWHDRMRIEHHDHNTAELQLLIADYLAAHDAEVPEDLPTPTYNRIRALIPTA